MAAYFCLICGILCFVYFLIIMVYTVNAFSRLQLLWLVFAVLLTGCGIALFWGTRNGSIWTKYLKCLIGIGIAAAVIIAARPVSGILSVMHAETEKNLSYLIVLGAHIYENRPTRSLKRRLDAAFAYAKENPDTILILSGGQGSDEIMSEALCMKQYLMGQGMEENRLILEDRSTTTYENLLYCDALTGCKEKETGILSNDFHVFRAVSLARKLGYTKACPVPASSEPVMQIHYIFREILAWWLGKMKGIL